MLRMPPLPPGEELLGAGYVHDVTDHCVEVVQHLRRVDAEYTDLAKAEPFVAGGVPFGAVAAFVGFAVDLHRQIDFGAVEVEDVRASRMLAAPLQARGSLAELAPEEDFGQAHGAPELLGAGDGLLGAG
jgi:hypothetical protein